MKINCMALLLVCGLPMALSPVPLAAQTPVTSSTATTGHAGAEASSGSLSADLAEVVKLVNSGVDDSVVLAFIQNSSAAYHPNADEIIKLRDLGVSSPVISALLNRGGELRAQSARAQSQASLAFVAPPAPASSEAPPPGSGYVVQGDYPAAASSVVYIGANPVYTYGSGYYYGYSGCYYPSYGYSSGYGYYPGYRYYPRYGYSRGSCYYPGYGNNHWGRGYYPYNANYHGYSHYSAAAPYNGRYPRAFSYRGYASRTGAYGGYNSRVSTGTHFGGGRMSGGNAGGFAGGSRGRR
jgi:hypothetical protein